MTILKSKLITQYMYILLQNFLPSPHTETPIIHYLNLMLNPQTNTGHNTDTSTTLIIRENEIIKCNDMCWCLCVLPPREDSLNN